MGGSNNFKNVDNYTTLAKYYDQLLQDEDALYLWLDYINQYAKGNELLELASGSGLMANLLSNNGYHVIASDISKDMQNIAKNNFNGEYLILDMIDFKLNKSFDVILCMLDSVNYLNDYEDLKKMFKNVYVHLNNNGIFVFDMHNHKRLDEFVDEYIEEGYLDDIPYQWTIQSDLESNCLYEHFAFYEEDGIVSENHIQHIFDEKKVLDLLIETGFEVRYIDDFIEDEKVLYIGGKK